MGQPRVWSPGVQRSSSVPTTVHPWCLRCLLRDGSVSCPHHPSSTPSLPNFFPVFPRLYPIGPALPWGSTWTKQPARLLKKGRKCPWWVLLVEGNEEAQSIKELQALNAPQHTVPRVL